MPKFVLPNDDKSTLVINDRYGFVDGEMPVSKADAPMIAKILCEYHGCTLVEDEVTESVTVEAKDSALTVDNTKTADAKPAATKK